MSDLENYRRAAELVQAIDLTPCNPQAFQGLLGRLWEQGMPPGDSPGWPSVDKLYTVVPGQLTILTGWPGSGKSEWLDACLLNLAQQGWRFALFSPENQPAELHVAKFVEKFIGKPFSKGPSERATLAEVEAALLAMNDWFAFLCPGATSQKVTFGIEEILGAAEAHFRLLGNWEDRNAKRGLVIDPWNEIEHLRPSNLSETEYISATLSRVRAWARAMRVHVWIVAHPQKLRRDDNGKLPIPRPDSISGSQHWWNKADNAITVWRALDDPHNQLVQVHVQKVRFKHVGRVGVAQLEYDRITGRYSEPMKTFSVVRGDF